MKFSNEYKNDDLYNILINRADNYIHDNLGKSYAGVNVEHMYEDAFYRGMLLEMSDENLLRKIRSWKNTFFNKRKNCDAKDIVKKAIDDQSMLFYQQVYSETHCYYGHIENYIYKQIPQTFRKEAAFRRIHLAKKAHECNVFNVTSNLKQEMFIAEGIEKRDSTTKEKKRGFC